MGRGESRLKARGKTPIKASAKAPVKAPAMSSGTVPQKPCSNPRNFYCSLCIKYYTVNDWNRHDKESHIGNICQWPGCGKTCDGDDKVMQRHLHDHNKAEKDPCEPLELQAEENKRWVSYWPGMKHCEAKNCKPINLCGVDCPKNVRSSFSGKEGLGRHLRTLQKAHARMKDEEGEQPDTKRAYHPEFLRILPPVSPGALHAVPPAVLHATPQPSSSDASQLTFYPTILLALDCEVQQVKDMYDLAFQIAKLVTSQNVHHFAAQIEPQVAHQLAPKLAPELPPQPTPPAVLHAAPQPAPQPAPRDDARKPSPSDASQLTFNPTILLALNCKVQQVKDMYDLAFQIAKLVTSQEVHHFAPQIKAQLEHQLAPKLAPEPAFQPAFQRDSQPDSLPDFHPVEGTASANSPAALDQPMWLANGAIEGSEDVLNEGVNQAAQLTADPSRVPYRNLPSESVFNYGATSSADWDSASNLAPIFRGEDASRQYISSPLNSAPGLPSDSGPNHSSGLYHGFNVNSFLDPTSASGSGFYHDSGYAASNWSSGANPGPVPVPHVYPASASGWDFYPSSGYAGPQYDPALGNTVPNSNPTPAADMDWNSDSASLMVNEQQPVPDLDQLSNEGISDEQLRVFQTSN